MSAAGKTNPFAKSRPSPLRDAVAANRRLLAVAFGFSAAMSILALTTSFYMLQVYDRVLTSRSIETLALLTVIAVGALAVFGWLDSLRLRLVQRVAMRTADALGKRVLRAMVATSSLNGGANIRNGLRDLDTVKNFIGSPAINVVLDAPFLIIFLIVLVMLHWVLLAIVIVGGAILIALAWAGQKISNPALTQSIESQSRTHNFAEDGLRNSDVLEGMGMSQTFVERWHGQWISSMRDTTRAMDRDSRMTSVSRAVRLLIQIALLGGGALLILDFKATGGIMIAASIIGARALAPIESGVASWKSFIAARLAWNRLDEILNSAPKRDEGMPLPAPQGRLSAIRLGYVNPLTRKTVLANVSIDLVPGESLGVIGPSASGKSTLVRLLVGAWPCTSRQCAAGRRRHLCLAAHRAQQICRLSAAGRRTLLRHDPREHRAHERRRSGGRRARGQACGSARDDPRACRKATTPTSASGACGSPAARRSVSASRVRSTAIRGWSCSTSPIPIWTRSGKKRS